MKYPDLRMYNLSISLLLLSFGVAQAREFRLHGNAAFRLSQDHSTDSRASLNGFSAEEGRDVHSPPPVWPDTFHALLTGNTSRGLQIVDLWYDWPRGRNANLIQSQHDPDGILYDLEYNNGTTYYFHPETATNECTAIPMGVGILPPDWLKNATYLGRETVDQYECDKWTKADFITYWADVTTGHPVRWIFLEDFMDMNVIRFEVGAVMPDSKW
eukprot:CAMPEP_0197853102 /NCGR_PEP_ID=MMETSP1438-20131217/22085_1 /TAXON_ID=1461541 /ORGANISM="Pterosperma sp., Strain CCMP1384" /LENGTH=213 /DNA_ID=CAMNT_0043467393 /DNA_START=321 /DNA_END=959 /DNA_ORIENTATION=+